MSHSRLLFLYPPNLFASASKLIPANSNTFRCVNTHQIRARQTAWGVRMGTGTTIHARGRHGKAVEPGPEFQKPSQQGDGGVKDTKDGSGEAKSVDKGKDGTTSSSPGQVNTSSDTEGASSLSPPSPPPSSPPPPDPTTSSSSSTADPTGPSTTDPSPSPSPPPPLPHLFDTYTLVHRLTPPFTLPQSINLMHLLRQLLSARLLHAQSTLLSQSAFSSSTYLFRSASSELRSEISTLRATQLEKMRQERTQVQREFELLNGRFMEELMVCGNEMRAMFNDRKMVNKSEQREVENKIQELNYKITVLMGSELKSEVEKLRWVTTRRGLIAIGILAAFIVSLIKLSQNSNKREKELERARAAAEAAAQDHEHFMNGHSHGTIGGSHIPVDGLVHTTVPVPVN